jgi:dihydroneopterin aldolase
LADVVALRGLRVLGRHGVLVEEKERAQPFEIDLDLEVDLRAAGASDALDDTVDYGAVADAVVASVQGEHADLLEHLAARVADVVFATSALVEAVTVTIRKLRPPVPVDLAWAAVTIRRRREEH